MTSPKITVEQLVKDYAEFREYLLSNGQISFESLLSDIFRKNLLISCASLFELQIQALVSQYVSKQTADPKINSLVQNRVIERQYHTYFNWKDKAAGPFYAMFGAATKEEISLQIKGDTNLKEGEKAFLDIGAQRNLLAHENFIEYQLSLTSQEIIDLYGKATTYVRYLYEYFGVIYQ